MANEQNIVEEHEVTTKQEDYINPRITGSVKSIINDPPPTGTLLKTDRFAIGPVPTGAWLGHAGQLTYWDSFNWIYTVPDRGFLRESILDGKLYLYNGATWNLFAADQIANTPAGGITATDVQAAIDELDTDKEAADATIIKVADIDTLAELNAIITNATLIDTADSRLSDARTPTDHKDSHISGGGDALLSTDLIEAIIKRIRTTTGPTNLLVGAIADGEFLKRDGTNIIGAAPSGLLTRNYDVSQRMRVGTGGSAALTGQIQDVPAILFNSGQDREMFFANHIHDGVDLSTVNPILRIAWIGTAAAVLNNETVRLQLEIRYRAMGEDFSGAYDETLIQDIDLPLAVANLHGMTDFTLDRSKIADGDGFSVRTLRVGTHGNDDYLSQFGIHEIDLVYSGTGGV